MKNVNSLLYNLAIRYRKKTKQSLNIKRWYGRRGGGTQRVYICYVCDVSIDTESACYPITRHAEDAINSHADFHLETLEAFI
jgi:hypothetical protein